MKIKITVSVGGKVEVGETILRDEQLVRIRENNPSHVHTNKKKQIPRKAKYKLSKRNYQKE